MLVNAKVLENCIIDIAIILITRLDHESMKMSEMVVPHAPILMKSL